MPHAVPAFTTVFRLVPSLTMTAGMADVLLRRLYGAFLAARVRVPRR
jgi:hypothetical protein